MDLIKKKVYNNYYIDEQSLKSSQIINSYAFQNKYRN